jgi:uncharacterized protein DUF4325
MISKPSVLRVRNYTDDSFADHIDHTEYVYAMLHDALTDNYTLIMDFADLLAVSLAFLYLTIGYLRMDFSAEEIHRHITFANIPFDEKWLVELLGEHNYAVIGAHQPLTEILINVA